jgi:hypothetical protein
VQTVTKIYKTTIFLTVLKVENFFFIPPFLLITTLSEYLNLPNRFQTSIKFSGVDIQKCMALLPIFESIEDEYPKTGFKNGKTPCI